jgi:hypothetical protein
LACFVVASYLLEAFNVVGYLWPNGDKGCGKTSLLHVVTEMAYLGQLLQAGGSYASLRDLADYGACLAFDDAEAVMDVQKGDPDKRTLLLAGNRRGATVTIKEPTNGRAWVTRYVNTFCPRAFSAIRLPDDVLASRTIIVPLVRSGDPQRAKANPADHATWPTDRRRLVDDLWAVGLSHLPRLREYDAKAAARSGLMGRVLDPWRPILAVALWLQEEHGVEGLFDRMEKLSVGYQGERSELEARDPTRLAIKALGQLVQVRRLALDAEENGFPAGDGQTFEFTTETLTGLMNQIAIEDEVVGKGRDFANSRRVGWILKRLRLAKGDRPTGETKRRWKVTIPDLEGLAASYGMTMPWQVVPVGQAGAAPTDNHEDF